MERENRDLGFGKAPELNEFELKSGVQEWEKGLHIMVVHPMDTTVHDSPPQPRSMAEECLLTDWRPDPRGAGSLQQVFVHASYEMRRSTEERRAVRAQKKAAAEAKQERRGHKVDVEKWRSQLRALIEEGREDINIGYWRVSTVKQTEAEGPESQIRDIVGYAVAHTGKGIDLWCFDVDSGKEESRVALDFLIEAMATGRVRSATAQRLDRFARNNYLAECLNREAFKNKVQLQSAKEHLPSGPVGILFRQILQALAQYEAALITTRLLAGKRVKKEIDGTWGGGTVPFGYWALGAGLLQICEPEAQIIKLIFLLYEHGYNQCAIARALNRWNIPIRNGGNWKQGHVRNILENEAKYRGEALFSMTVTESEQVAHPQILPNRPEGQRTYLLGLVKTYKDVEVPDDLDLSDFSNVRVRKVGRKLTAEQARTLQTLYALRDQGLSINRVTDELNRLELKTISGREWKRANTHDFIRRRKDYEPAIAEALAIEVADLGFSTADEGPAIARIHELRTAGLSFTAIRDRLGREGFKTARGATWSLSSIYRVAMGKARRVMN